jgi:outer membrane beta-barrel protein
MMKAILIPFFVLSFFIGLPVGVDKGHSQDLLNRTEISPFIGGYFFDRDLDLDNDLVYGVRLGYFFTKALEAEISFEGVSTEDDRTNGDADLLQWHIDGLYHFPINEKLFPYLAVGMGVANYDIDGRSSDSDFLLNYGAGVKYLIKDWLAIRLDARQPVTFDDTNFNFMVNLGLSFLFGGPPKAAAVAPAADSDGDGVPDDRDRCPGTPAGAAVDSVGCPLDSDGDGVPDYMDRCPDTPRGVKVDTQGCPIDSDGDGVPDYLDQCPDTPKGVAVDDKGCPLDSDGDGVPDYKDKCPDTPKGVAVDARGCPIDSDGDGVLDYKDKCPDTPKGVKVNSLGCPLDTDGDGVYDYLDRCPDTPRGVRVDEKGCLLDSDKDGVYDYLDKCPGTPYGATVDERGCWVIKGVQFDTARWDIKPLFYPILDNIVYILQRNPSLRVEVQGHTDNRGSAAYNKKLSENRARAVMEYFIERGIERSRLSAVGYGLSRPAASNMTEVGRAKNRRVELKPIR